MASSVYVKGKNVACKNTSHPFKQNVTRIGFVMDSSSSGLDGILEAHFVVKLPKTRNCHITHDLHIL